MVSRCSISGSPNLKRKAFSSAKVLLPDQKVINRPRALESIGINKLLRAGGCSMLRKGQFLSMPEVLSISKLTKSYGDKIAVGGISFKVNRNEIVWLLGPNGAGKTTTISMILGVLEPD